MIIRKNLKLSIILKFTWKVIIAYAIIGTFAFIIYEIVGVRNVKIPFAVIGTLGMALAIILGFRNSASYDRWWEARKIWGGIVNYSRTFSRQITTMIDNQFTENNIRGEEIYNIHKKMIYRHIAWINTLRLQLRKQNNWETIKPFISDSEYNWLMKRKNKATQLIQLQAEALQKFRKNDLIDDFRHIQMDFTLTEFYNFQGKAERIKNTPLARQYDYFPKLFMSLFIVLFPFGLIETLANNNIAWLVIPLTTAVGFVFYIIGKIGEINEDPFENIITDTPMTALCRTIEIDLREMLKETELPPSITPEDGYLY